jgi:hypothetical protein
VANWWDKPVGWLRNAYANVQEWDKSATAEVMSSTAGRAILGSVNAVKNTVVKPAVREALILSRDAGNLFTWSMGKMYEDTRDAFTKGPFRERTGPRGLDAVQQVADQLVTYQRTKTGGSTFGDVGTGYLPAGEAARRADEAVLAARPTVGKLPFTLGRAAAYPLVQLGVTSQDAILHGLVSGGIDLVAAVKNPIDPFNWISPIKPAGAGRFSEAAQGAVRIDDANEFGDYFTRLQARYLELQDDLVTPQGRVYNDAERKIIDQYETITRPVKPTLQTPYPTGSANAGRTADTFEAAAVYNYWKPIADDAVADLANKAGVVNDIAPSIIRSQYDRWRTSGEGQSWAQQIIDKINDGTLGVQELWRSPMFQREGIGTVVRLIDKARAGGTPDDVFAILDEAVNTFDPAFSVRNVGTRGIDAVRTQSGAIIKTVTQQRKLRSFEVLPESLKIGFSDPTASARNLDNLMGVIGIEYKQRGVWLEDFARALQGNKDDMFDFYSRFQDKVVRARLEQRLQKFDIPGFRTAVSKVLTDGVLRELTSWTGKATDEVVQYLTSDLGQAVPLPWITGDGIAPMRYTQLLTNDYHIIQPAVIDDIIDLANDFGAFVSVMSETPLIGGAVKVEQAFVEGFKTYLSRVWKPGRVAKLSHLVRVAPEEVARVMASGIIEHPAELLMAMMGRTLKYDATGRALTDIPNVVKVSRDLLDLDELLKEAQGYAKRLAAGEALTGRQEQLAGRVNEIGEKIIELEARLENISPISEVLIGPGRRAAIGVATGDIRNLYRVQMRRGVMQIPSRAVSSQQDKWIKGISHEISDMYANAEYRRVAGGGLGESDVITINGVEKKIAEHIADGAVHPFTGQPLANDLDAVKLWLFQGGGRNIFVNYFDNIANLKPQYGNGAWDNYATASERIDYIGEDLRFVTGMDPVLLDVVATGNYKGVKATLRNPQTGRGQVSPELRDFIANDFMNSQHAPLQVRFWPQREFEGLKKAAGGISNAWDRLLAFYFEDIYGRTSDLASRSPTWRAGYWSRMEELIPAMRPADAQKALDAARKANLTPTRLERIELQAARAQKGNTGTLKAASLLAEQYAKNYTNDLLYNANKRSLFGRQHAIMFAFFEAWREVTGTWLRLNARNPRIIRNVGQMIETSQESGWTYSDREGRQVFEVPMTGELARIWLSEDNKLVKNFTVGVNALNVAGRGVPGFGPVAQFIGGQILPQNANYDWLRKQLSPFGEPDTQNPQWQNVFVPPAIRQLAAQSQSGDGFWSTMSKWAVGDIRKDDYYQRAYVRLAEYLASTGGDKYMGAGGLQRLLSDAERLAFRITTVRGLAAFAGPGAPITTWFANTDIGPVELGILTDDLYRREDEAVKRGAPRYEGFNEWIGAWGDVVWPYFGAITESNIGGLTSTREFVDWSKSNTRILEQYPLVGGYFGPRSGERTLEAWQAQMAGSQRDIRDARDKIADAQDKFGNYLYYKAIAQIPPQLASSVSANQYRADVRDALQERFPGWRSPGADRAEFREEIRAKIDQLRVAVKDPRLASAPVSSAIIRYLEAREAAIAGGIKASGGKMTRTNWVDSKSGRSVRLYLSLQVAPALVAQTPEFRDVYEQVLAYEFIVDEE